ncbi:MAG: ribbon-helix-helix domain-containing protein [Thermodesulfobacteriota bacterium]|jgi:predicted DNA-binding protein
MRPKLLTAINFYVATAQIKGLKALSKKTGLSVSEHVRRAIDEYLKEQRK